MIISSRGGHSPNCLGAIGLANEWVEMQKLYKEVEIILKLYGHTVINCNSNANTERGELSEGANKSNSVKGVDLFISFHMNAFNGQANGVEALIHVNGREFVTKVAQRLCNNFATLGLQNRGVKRVNDYEMRNVNAPNIIFETMFCDNAHDINEVWNKNSLEKMARLICNAIDPNIPIELPPKEEVKKDLRRVISNGVQVGAYKEIENVANKVKDELLKGANKITIEEV